MYQSSVVYYALFVVANILQIKSYNYVFYIKNEESDRSIRE